MGTAALVTVSPKGGVSLSINVNYLSKAPLGGSVLVEARVGWAGALPRPACALLNSLCWGHPTGVPPWPTVPGRRCWRRLRLCHVQLAPVGNRTAF